MIRCPRCTATLDDSAHFCHSCGAPLIPSGQAEYGLSRSPNGQDMGYPPPYDAAPSSFEQHPTIGEILGKSFAFIGHRPTLLWGLSLLYMLLCILAAALSILPIIWIPLILLLSVGMAAVFLNAYRGEDIGNAQLFIAFKNLPHFLCGMAWMCLRIFIWGLIPVAGLVFAAIKAYSYRFVPYILLAEPDIAPSDALKKSVTQTNGFKGRMFGADLLMVACVLAAYLAIAALSYIPYMGIIFEIIACLLSLVVCLFAPLVFGTVQAAFYDEIQKTIPEFSC